MKCNQNKAYDKSPIRLCVISGFRREIADSCALLGFYTASSDNFLPTFRDNLSVPCTGFKNPKLNSHYSVFWRKPGLYQSARQHPPGIPQIILTMDVIYPRSCVFLFPWQLPRTTDLVCSHLDSRYQIRKYFSVN
jgi:hypothetical protein